MIDPETPLLFDPLRFPTPEARFDELVEEAQVTGAFGLIIWANEERRSVQLRASAMRYGGIVHVCEHYRSLRQFALGLIESMGITARSGNLWPALFQHLEDHQRPLFLDRVDRLRPSLFRALFDFYDVAPFLIMCSREDAHPEIVNDVQHGGYFRSRCIGPLRLEDGSAGSPSAEELPSVAGRIVPS